jgi:cell division septum initiation protein DivIVA
MGINTLEIANRLKAAEREGRAAEEIALVFQEVFEQQLGQLVTKEYLHTELDRLRAEFRAEIAELRSELKGDIAQLRTEMTELRSKLEGDIAELRGKVEGDIAQLRGEVQLLRADMEKMELRITNALTLRLGALIAGAVAVLGGLNIFF